MKRAGRLSHSATQASQPVRFILSGDLAEIVGVGLQLEAARRGGVHLGGDPVLIRVSQCVSTARKVQLDLHLGVARACPPHQRIRAPGLCGREFEGPFIKPGAA